MAERWHDDEESLEPHPDDDAQRRDHAAGDGAAGVLDPHQDQRQDEVAGHHRPVKRRERLALRPPEHRHLGRLVAVVGDQPLVEHEVAPQHGHHQQQLAQVLEVDRLQIGLEVEELAENAIAMITGTVYVQPLAPKNANNNFSVASVTFEPGARAFWHSHPAGQTILVTAGKGLYQEKGKTIRALNKGAVVLCEPDIEHWHGASPQTAMTHVVITNYKGDTQVNWLRPVTDEEYKAGVQ